MTIKFKTDHMNGYIELNDEAKTDDVIDAVTAALIAEGYAISSIADCFYDKAKALGYDESEDKYE